MAGGNTIAKGSVLITTDADKLHSGLSGAGNDIKKWGHKTGEESGGIFHGAFAKGAKLGAGFAVGMAAAKGIMHLADEFSELSEQIDKTSKLANTLDMPTEELVGWQHAANLSGVSQDELSASLLKFRRQVEGPLDGALMSLAEKLENTEDAGARASLLVDAFGKSGAKLAPMFKDGAKGIQEMIGEAKSLGIAFDKETGEQIEAANDAITRVKVGFKGLLQGVLIGMAPFMEKLAKFAQKMVTWLKPPFDWFSRTLTQIWDLGEIVFEGFQELAAGAAVWFEEFTDGLFGWTSELPTVQEIIVSVFRAVGIAAALAWDTIKAGAGAIVFVAGIMVLGVGKILELFREMVELAEALPEELRPAGIDRFIKGVKEAEDAVKGAGFGMADWGKKAVLNFGKSAIDFNMWLDKMLEKKEKVEKPLEPKGMKVEDKSDPFKMGAALDIKSKEAYSLIVTNRFRDLMGGDTAKETLKGIKGIKKETAKGTDELKEIKKKLDAIKDV